MKAALSFVVVLVIVTGSMACNPDQHNCGEGKCVPMSFVCDGVFDCGDGNDENNCAKTRSASSSSFDDVMEHELSAPTFPLEFGP